MNTTELETLTLISEFNKTENPFRQWSVSDIFVPKELKELAIACNPKSSLELGCGLGRFSSYLGKQGIKATGIDFSQKAIEKAEKRAIHNPFQPTFMTGDVTHLNTIDEQFDMSFDIGYFQYLSEDEQQQYVSEIARLLPHGAIHLLWAMDSLLSDLKFSLEYIIKMFEKKFQLVSSTSSRRRLMPSHWYWFVRK